MMVSLIRRGKNLPLTCRNKVGLGQIQRPRTQPIVLIEFPERQTGMGEWGLRKRRFYSGTFSQYLQRGHVGGIGAQLLLWLWVLDLRSNFILSVKDVRHSFLFVGRASCMWLHVERVPLGWKSFINIIPDGFVLWLYDPGAHQISNPVHHDITQVALDSNIINVKQKFTQR